MKICVDKNKLVVIENPNIPKVRKYSQEVNGYIFSDFDKGMLVYHKKQIKIVNLKNLGEGMAVFYVKRETVNGECKLDRNGFIAGMCNYKAFDEKNGKHYFFLPKFRESEMEKVNENLKKLGMQVKLEKTNKGIVVRDNGEWKMGNGNILSKLFAFVLLYGKLDIRGGELYSFKFHLPLFGSYLPQKDYLDEEIDELKNQGFFVKKNILKTNDGMIYQVSSNDYELLQIFAKFYEPIEKIAQITKYVQTLEAKKMLVEFIENDILIPEEGKNDVLYAIETGIVKMLVK